MVFIHLKRRRILPVFILMIVLSGAVCRAEVRTEPDLFPRYPCIEPNVAFWTKIYTQYSSDQGVIHDSRRMDRIYGVIALEDPYLAGGRKINKKRIKNAKKRYKAILAKLMQGKPPAGLEEQRVAEQFGPDATAAEFRLAMRNLRCQTGQKDRFREGLIRSGAYIDEIKQIFNDAGLPEDLAYLPHVESSFNPKAYSKFGAAGMWQFTRSTGKRFMKVGYTIDERRDPILSSRAAAQLLRHNHSKLATWPMAITAYNHGETGMRRAQSKKGGYELIFKEYRSRIFKFASRNFYSEFLAAREAAKNYRQYFGDLKLDTPLDTREIELSGYVSLPELARHLNLDLDELRELNPALRSPVFRGQKYVPRGFRLRLPAGDDRDLELFIARLPETLYRQNQKRSTIYTVDRGDTAGKIAKTHGVNLNELIAVNNLDRRATIYPNQKLRIPLPEEKPIWVAQRSETKQRPVEQPPPASNPVLAQQAPQSAAAIDPVLRHSAAELTTLAVAEGEPNIANAKTAQAVAQTRPPQLPSPADQLAAFLLARAVVSEQMSEKQASEPETTRPGAGPVLAEPVTTPLRAAVIIDSTGEGAGDAPQPIRSDEEPEMLDNEIALLPAPSQQQEIATEETADAVVPESPADQQNPAFISRQQSPPGEPTVKDLQFHPEIMQGHFAVERVSMQRGKSIGYIRVEAEETLGHYAEWLDVSAQEIRRLNGFAYGRPLHLSQQIKIPLHRVAKEGFEEKRFEFHQELAEDFFASYRVEKIVTYSIKRGDSIWTLSRQEFEVPLWLIQRYNSHVDFSALVPMQKIRIPVVEKEV